MSKNSRLPETYLMTTTPKPKEVTFITTYVIGILWTCPTLSFTHISPIFLWLRFIHEIFLTDIFYSDGVYYDRKNYINNLYTPWFIYVYMYLYKILCILYGFMYNKILFVYNYYTKPTQGWV